MTTLSIAVSVAVVMLDNIRTEVIQEKRHRLYVDFPLLRVSLLSQSGEPTLEVVASGPWVTRLTFVILPNDSQSCPIA